MRLTPAVEPVANPWASGVLARFPGIDLAREHGRVDNFLWANDYPHDEGSWPHSGVTIERTMGGLEDGERARIPGLNAAKLFGFEVPSRTEAAGFPA
jgi:hypothetical protein